MRSWNTQEEEVVVRFYVKSLFASEPVHEAMKAVRKRLVDDIDLIARTCDKPCIGETTTSAYIRGKGHQPCLCTQWTPAAVSCSQTCMGHEIDWGPTVIETSENNCEGKLKEVCLIQERKSRKGDNEQRQRC